MMTRSGRGRERRYRDIGITIGSGVNIKLSCGASPRSPPMALKPPNGYDESRLGEIARQVGDQVGAQFHELLLYRGKVLSQRLHYGKHQFGIADAVAGKCAADGFEAERAFRRLVMNISNRAKVWVDPRKGDDPRRILLHRGDHALVFDSIVRVRIGFRKPHHHVDAIGVHIGDQLVR